MREWLVAGALIEADGSVLLVRNVRPSGHEDWSTPGGVIDADDATLLDGLAREVHEETGLRVVEWEGPVYEVRADAVDLGWSLRVEVHRAVEFEGELSVDDPDGIVTEAAFFTPEQCSELLADVAPWVREPLGEWLTERWSSAARRGYQYRVHGTERRSLDVRRHQ